MDTINIAKDIINGVTETSKDLDCVHYYTELRDKSKDETLDKTIQQLVSLVADVACYHFSPESTHEPYVAYIVMQSGRSPIPDDLTEEGLELLSQLCDLLASSLLQVRIYDVLWLKQRNPDHAKKAIELYISCADKTFDLNNWVGCAEYAERSLRLASLFRKKEPELTQKVANLLIGWIKNNYENDELFLTAKSISLLLDFGYGNLKELFAISEEIATLAGEKGDFHRAEEYWKIAVRVARNAELKDEEYKAQSALAESYALCAHNETGSKMSASHWMQQAVEAYKKVPDSFQRREELYKELLKLQKESLSEIGKIETPIKVSEAIAETVKIMSGATLRNAFFNLGFIVLSIPSYTRIEDHAKELTQKFPLSRMFGSIHMDSEGKVLSKTPAKDLQDVETVSKKEIYQAVAFEHQYAVTTCILPAVEVIMNEHSVSLADFETLAINNPFIKPGQEQLFAKGLFLGLKGEYDVSLSLLVPLLESSLRYILSQSGVTVSSLNTHGVQEEMRIGAILAHEASEKIFGKDIIMDLNGLLLDRTYANLRNIISHGLGGIGTFYSYSAVYLWWLMFRLFLTPHTDALSEGE